MPVTTPLGRRARPTPTVSPAGGGTAPRLRHERVDHAPVRTDVAHPDDRYTVGDPYLERGPRHVGYLLVASVVTLPVLVPSGPGNTALADVGILALVVAVFVWLRHDGLTIALPPSPRS
jgi:hypothetical protein